MNRLILGIFTASLATGFVAGYVFGSYYTIRIEKVKEDIKPPEEDIKPQEEDIKHEVEYVHIAAT